MLTEQFTSKKTLKACPYNLPKFDGESGLGFDAIIQFEFNAHIASILAQTKLYVAEIINLTTSIKGVRKLLEDHISAVLQHIPDVCYLPALVDRLRTVVKEAAAAEERAEGETVSTKVACTRTPEA